MAESDYARKMRREAEQQTRFSSDQAYYAQQAAQKQAEAAQESQAAARYAAEAAAYAASQAKDSARQLKMQRKLNDSTASHHFAMWRQTTRNGEWYEQWVGAAEPLVGTFNGRWDQWLTAKNADIRAVTAKREAESTSRFNVDADLAVRGVSSVDGPWWDSCKRMLGVVVFFVGFTFMLWVAVLLYMAFAPYNWPDPTNKHAFLLLRTELFLLGAYVILELFWLYPRNRKMHKSDVMAVKAAKEAVKAAKSWVDAEVITFSKSLPDAWYASGHHQAWNQLCKAGKTIKDMPAVYVDFRPQMLVDLSGGLPAVAPASALHPEATRMRALVSSWRQM